MNSMTSPRPACRHCGCRPARAGSKLCWKCYQTPAVCDLYPTTQVAGPGSDNPASRPPAQPTLAPAGTVAKMREFRRRILRGESLHHPADNPDTGPPTELWPFEGTHSRFGDADPLEDVA